MLKEKDYCDYDTYVALEELGYPEVMAFNKPFLLYEVQKWLREKKLLHIVIDKLLYGAYEFSVVDILNYSEEKTVQLILTKKPFPKVSKKLLKFWRRSKMTHEEKQIHNAIHAELRDFKEFKELVKRMREAQKQWGDGDPFDYTEMELAKRMCEAEREVDEYLKKIE